MAIGYLIDIEFLWGFQAKIVGLSKTSPSFYYPPPSTFLGSIAEVIAKENFLGEDEGKKVIPVISERLLALGVKPLNCIPIKYEDLNRIVTIKITGETGLCPDPSSLRSSFDSPAFGKTIFSTFDQNPPLLRYFLVLRDELFKINDKVFSVDEETFWKIHRIGSKESLVSCDEVKRVDVKILKETAFTTYSFPLTDDVIPISEREGRWERELYIDLFKMGLYSPINYLLSKNLATHMIPIRRYRIAEPEYHVRFTNNIAAYVNEREVVIGRWLE
ncbi:MAG: type I-A CRISPR-associated protein Cas5 [Nitrososphaeria archaeon]